MGGDDCMTFPATWAREVIGQDPAESLRGTYRTREAAHAIMEVHGGPLRFMDGKLAAIGAKRVQQPIDGDIGLVRTMAGETPAEVKVTEVGAIRFGPVWAFIGPKGVIARPAEMIAAWRLPA